METNGSQPFQCFGVSFGFLVVLFVCFQYCFLMNGTQASEDYKLGC